jgi:hypothetical protein
MWGLLEAKLKTHGGRASGSVLQGRHQPPSLACPNALGPNALLSCWLALLG